MLIAFMRHGQTEWNARHLLQGSNRDIDLTDEGVHQVEAAADGLVRGGWRFDRVYVSPYRRAVHSAEIVCSRLGGTPIVDDRVREIAFGEYEGTPYLNGDYVDDNIRSAFECPSKYVPRGGESYDEVMSRVRDFLEHELKPLEGTCERVLVVAHGGLLRAVMATVADVHLDDYWRGRQPNCCVHLVTLEDGRFTLRERNVDPKAGGALP